MISLLSLLEIPITSPRLSRSICVVLLQRCWQIQVLRCILCLTFVKWLQYNIWEVCVFYTMYAIGINTGDSKLCTKLLNQYQKYILLLRYGPQCHHLLFMNKTNPDLFTATKYIYDTTYRHNIDRDWIHVLGWGNISVTRERVCNMPYIYPDVLYWLRWLPGTRLGLVSAIYRLNWKFMLHWNCVWKYWNWGNNILMTTDACAIINRAKTWLEIDLHS